MIIHFLSSFLRSKAVVNHLKSTDKLTNLKKSLCKNNRVPVIQSPLHTSQHTITTQEILHEPKFRGKKNQKYVTVRLTLSFQLLNIHQVSCLYNCKFNVKNLCYAFQTVFYAISTLVLLLSCFFYNIYLR